MNAPRSDKFSRDFHIVLDMANKTEYDTKLNAEGRVVIPAEARRMLGVEAGGRILIVVDGPDVRLVTPRLLAEQVWANNQAGGAGDSAIGLRLHREADGLALEDRWARIEAAAAADTSSDEHVLADLLDGLGLNP
jgi:AbrB family looped-hinge helix DNA binding protein